MSKVPSNYPQQPGHPPSASSVQFKVSCPGWLEIVVGLVVLATDGGYTVS